MTTTQNYFNIGSWGQFSMDWTITPVYSVRFAFNFVSFLVQVFF